jgi:translation initiation factor 2A
VTPDEAQLFRPSASDITIFSPPMAARPTTRLKVDGQIRGLFMSRPSELPQGTTSSKPLRAYPEPALAVWVGERKGAPATLALYTLSSLLGKPKAGDEDKTETRDLPMTVARKAFYKADKINLKWNNAGTMVSSRILVVKLTTGSVPHAHRRRQLGQVVLRRDQPVPGQP